jgi:4-hydroxythreonine-4-phosphate dehydrogenase
MKKVAISIGDLNGVGLEIVLKSHDVIKEICQPVYIANEKMVSWGAALLGLEVPDDFKIKNIDGEFEIEPGVISAQSGEFSFNSFVKAVKMVQKDKADAVVTMPISKEAWALSDIEYAGHTDYLDNHFEKKAIMLMGCDELYCALFTHHIPLSQVPSMVQKKSLQKFLINLKENLDVDKIGVLGLNPHASDGGMIGDEEEKIKKAIKKANKELGSEVFFGPIVPDVAFTPRVRKEFNYYVCMYHDQGLAPLKALYFDESINISLNLPITRVSVDHGTAFDIAYKDANPSNTSYINAVKKATEL